MIVALSGSKKKKYIYIYIYVSIKHHKNYVFLTYDSLNIKIVNLL